MNWINVKDDMPPEKDSIFAKYYGTDKWTPAMFKKASKDVLVTIEFDAGKCERKENTDMSAVEFLKVFKKICSEECTDKCPFDDEKEGCSFYKDDIHVIIRKVEAWIKAHSIANLTERQKIAIKGRIAEGYLWVTKDKGKYGVSFFNKEQRDFGTYSSISYDYSDTSYCDLYNFVTKENSPIYLPDLLKENN